jgi:hypothetical protein
MSSFAKLVAVLCLGFIVTTMLGAADATPKPKSARATPKVKKSKTPSPDETPAPHRTEIPVIEGHPAKRLRIPEYNEQGKLESIFKIAVASRIDVNHVNLQDMQIETFDEKGARELGIDLPDSILDSDTNIITTKHHAKISRDDFVITGDAMVFNTRTKQGGMAGHVHMIIYDLKSKTGQDDDPAKNSTTPAPKKP